MATAIALPRPLAGGPSAYDPPVREAASDQQLARRAAGGDTAAFELLVQRHQHRLYTLALRVTLSEADARDCVQEGLIAAWRSMHRFRGDASFSTWMYRIVVRKAYDALDRRARDAVPAEEIAVVAAATSPDERLDLVAALARLEPEFRAVAVACDVLGMSMEEAAGALEIPAGTVRSRLHRARGRLAVMLEGERAR